MFRARARIGRVSGVSHVSSVSPLAFAGISLPTTHLSLWFAGESIIEPLVPDVFVNSLHDDHGRLHSENWSRNLISWHFAPNYRFPCELRVLLSGRSYDGPGRFGT